MTEAMPFLRKLILLSYDPRPFCRALFFGFSHRPAGFAWDSTSAAVTAV